MTELSHVLNIGSNLGGPARYLAGMYVVEQGQGLVLGGGLILLFCREVWLQGSGLRDSRRFEQRGNGVYNPVRRLPAHGRLGRGQGGGRCWAEGGPDADGSAAV